MKEDWNSAIQIIEQLEAAGFEAYFVGGCVRDFLLGRPLKDIDLATSALPEEVMNVFSAVIPTGIEHGTVMVRHNQGSYEVTTFRHESTYTDKRHPDKVYFVRNIRDDLARRDFTINALAMDKNNQIIDLFEGKKDLENRLIQTVGSAKERFNEDALRILRALRFSSQLGFSIHTETLKQMRNLKYDIKYVAIERIKTEMEKFFQGDYLETGLAYIQETDIHYELPVFSVLPAYLLRQTEGTRSFISFPEVIAYYYSVNSSVSIDTWAREWKCSNKEKQTAKRLVMLFELYQSDGLNNWVVYQTGRVLKDHFLSLVDRLVPDAVLNNLKQDFKGLYNQLTIHLQTEIDIKGNEIADLYPELKAGAWISELFNKIEFAIVTNELSNKNYDIKEWIKCHPPGKS